ncbi:MAG: hypothetical protein HY237_04175 [Acidobacteria bacterium]|nr:hypothetical protein [Acidobacteriota bacterium]
MNKRVFFVLAALAVLLAGPLMVSAQAQQEPPNFLYVSDWAIPRPQWADWVASNEKNNKPIYDKMLADGTIRDYGMYTTIVHDESGVTHGSWFEATNMAALEKVLAEVGKLPPNPIANAATKHRDYLLRTSLRRVKAASGTNGYLWVSATQVQAGKGQEWRALWDKYSKPLFEELMANGTLLMYEVEVEQVHTDNPGWVYIVWMTANADAMDKFFAAAAARGQKRSAEENRAIGEAFAAVTTPTAHRDYYARVNHYAQK